MDTFGLDQTYPIIFVPDDDEDGFLCVSFDETDENIPIAVVGYNSAGAKTSSWLSKKEAEQLRDQLSEALRKVGSDSEPAVLTSSVGAVIPQIHVHVYVNGAQQSSSD